ncbi:NPCBM/NEW2 domain-containing protein [Solihabitans fulvus]|uniref:NPCBM/NEW2 domain-containing protein n=1 Tax=Solihabitans fulvus TaxID=1892852 RepID=UPI001CB76005|nr:NPCBM/NEW2 domain-containing protein [Solihabitans fulvus]
MRSVATLTVALLLPLVSLAGTATAAPTQTASQTPSQTPTAAAPSTLAATPPMGWNSWNRFGCHIDENLIRQTADNLVSTGMRDAGYTYVNIDDCWMAPARDAAGKLQADPTRFPGGIKALADYVHGRGLKLGIYSSAGTATCQGLPASLDHEQADAQSFADWGVDYLKYDNCNNLGRPAQPRYQAMSDALRATGRPIVLSLCEWGENKPWEWGKQVGGNLWRTTGDIWDAWGRMTDILDQQVGLEKFSGPGAWNDPDMLEVGNGGMTDSEYRAHFALWSLLNAPLIAGNDLASMDYATKRILLNRDVIAVDQDWGGVQGHRIARTGNIEVWAKSMSDGSAAVALFNRGDTTALASTDAHALGLPATRDYAVRDLWTHEDAETSGAVRASVPAHSASVFRVWPNKGHGQTPLSTFSLQVPEFTEVGKPFTITGQLYDDGSTPLRGGQAQLQAPDGWVVDGGPVVTVPRVAAGQNWSHTWTLRPSAAAFAANSGNDVSVSASASFRTITGQQARQLDTKIVAVTLPPRGDVLLGDQPWISATNGWGPVKRNSSNGELDPGTGHTISIAGVKHEKGLGTHAFSSVRFYLGGTCTQFHAEVGVDDEAGPQGSVDFHVLGDGTELAGTGVVKSGQAATVLDAPTTGVRVLELRVNDGGNGNRDDHADWADVSVHC